MSTQKIEEADEADDVDNIDHLVLLFEMELYDNEITDDYEPTMIMQDEVEDEPAQYDELQVEQLLEIEVIDYRLIYLELLSITLEDEGDEQEAEQNEPDDQDEGEIDEIILETEYRELIDFDEVDEQLPMIDDYLYMMVETEAPEQ